MSKSLPLLVTLPADWQAALDRIAKRRGAASTATGGDGSPLTRSAAVRELIRDALPEAERAKLSEPGKPGKRTGKSKSKKTAS